MELRQEDLCCNHGENVCNGQLSAKNLRECIFNLIIYEDDYKILFYNFPEKQIFKIERGKGLNEIDFRTAIREIDIIPSKPPEWKKIQILKLAKNLGFFGI